MRRPWVWMQALLLVWAWDIFLKLKILAIQIKMYNFINVSLYRGLYFVADSISACRLQHCTRDLCSPHREVLRGTPYPGCGFGGGVTCVSGSTRHCLISVASLPPRQPKCRGVVPPFRANS